MNSITLKTLNQFKIKMCVYKYRISSSCLRIWGCSWNIQNYFVMKCIQWAFKIISKRTKPKQTETIFVQEGYIRILNNVHSGSSWTSHKIRNQKTDTSVTKKKDRWRHPMTSALSLIESSHAGDVFPSVSVVAILLLHSTLIMFFCFYVSFSFVTWLSGSQARVAERKEICSDDIVQSLP